MIKVDREGRVVEQYRLEFAGGPFRETSEIAVGDLVASLDGWTQLLDAGDVIQMRRQFLVTPASLSRSRTEVYIRSIRPGSVLVDMVRLVSDHAVAGLIEGASFATAVYIAKRRAEILQWLRDFVQRLVVAKRSATSYESLRAELVEYLVQCSLGLVDEEEALESIKVFDAALGQAGVALHAAETSVALRLRDAPDSTKIELRHRDYDSLIRLLPDREPVEVEKAIVAEIEISRLNVQSGAVGFRICDTRIASGAKGMQRGYVMDRRVRDPLNMYALALAEQKPIFVQMQRTIDDDHESPFWQILGLAASRDETLFGSGQSDQSP